MNNRESYPLFYRWVYAKGREKEFIPLEERNQIPRQTKWHWRHLDAESIKLLEQSKYLQNELETLKDMESSKLYIYKKYLHAAARAQIHTINFIGKKNYYKLLSKNKEAVVNEIKRQSKNIDKATLLSFLRLPKQKYNIWKSQVEYNCKSSAISLCAKKFSNQTSLPEFRKIEKSLRNQELLHWPKSAVHAYMLKNEKFTLSRSTYYKYAQIIEPKNNRKIGRKFQKVPLRAENPNDLWHFDISYFRTLDGKKHYIYAIIDNYSRMIIDWMIRDKIRNSNASNLLLRALGLNKPENLKLMSDGGTENTGRHIRKVLNDYQIKFGNKVEHMIALKDINYSNNMIERFFRIMKSNYLYLSDIESGDILVTKVREMVNEYNFVRPHYAHGIFTPYEAYIKKSKPDYRKRYHLALLNRIKTNKNCSCTVCTCK